jgi:hypothetical protein
VLTKDKALIFEISNEAVVGFEILAELANFPVQGILAVPRTQRSALA